MGTRPLRLQSWHVLFLPCFLLETLYTNSAIGKVFLILHVSKIVMECDVLPVSLKHCMFHKSTARCRDEKYCTFQTKHCTLRRDTARFTEITHVSKQCFMFKRSMASSIGVSYSDRQSNRHTDRQTPVCPHWGGPSKHKQKNIFTHTEVHLGNIIETTIEQTIARFSLE